MLRNKQIYLSRKESLLPIKPYSFCKSCLRYYYRTSNEIGSFCADCCIILMKCPASTLQKLKEESVMKVWKKIQENKCNNCHKVLKYGKLLWTVKRYTCSYTCYKSWKISVLLTVNMILKLRLCGIYKDIRLMIMSYITFPEFNLVPHNTEGRSYEYISSWGVDENGRGKCKTTYERFTQCTHINHPSIGDINSK